MLLVEAKAGAVIKQLSASPYLAGPCNRGWLWVR